MYLPGAVPGQISLETCTHGLNLPWTDAIDMNSFLRQLVAKRFCHLQHAALGRRVRGNIVHADEGGHGADIDNFPRLIERQ